MLNSNFLIFMKHILTTSRKKLILSSLLSVRSARLFWIPKCFSVNNSYFMSLVVRNWQEALKLVRSWQRFASAHQKSAKKMYFRHIQQKSSLYVIDSFELYWKELTLTCTNMSVSDLCFLHSYCKCYIKFTSLLCLSVGKKK